MPAEQFWHQEGSTLAGGGGGIGSTRAAGPGAIGTGRASE